MNKLTLSALALLMTLGLAACSQDDNEGVDLEEAGDNVEEMADDAGDAVEETYEDATGQNDSAWDETKDAAGDAAEEKTPQEHHRRLSEMDRTGGSGSS